MSSPRAQRINQVQKLDSCNASYEHPCDSQLLLADGVVEVVDPRRSAQFSGGRRGTGAIETSKVRIRISAIVSMRTPTSHPTSTVGQQCIMLSISVGDVLRLRANSFAGQPAVAGSRGVVPEIRLIEDAHEKGLIMAVVMVLNC
uniref:Uncharacterized protein n=1 Tax=Oryza punctata TaxID=4537 RepID=A0A0E0MJV1_ORYPU